MADHFKTAQPVEYLLKFLENEIREDGRELGESRHTTINVGSITTAAGSALVKIGHTTIVCAIKGELSTPPVETPDQGFIVPNVEMSPMCSSSIKPGMPGTMAQMAGQIIHKVIKSSKCLKPEDLCISKHNLCWVLYCDIQCLDWDGNLLDGCVLALIAALINTRLPKVSWDEETATTTTHPDELVSLPIYSIPLSTTFMLFQPYDSDILIVDPTHEEEQVATGAVTIVTVDDKICLYHQPGGSSITDKQFHTMTERAFQNASYQRDRLQTELGQQYNNVIGALVTEMEK